MKKSEKTFHQNIKKKKSPTMSLLFEEKFVRQKFPLTKFSTKKKVIQFYQNSVKKKKTEINSAIESTL